MPNPAAHRVCLLVLLLVACAVTCPQRAPANDLQEMRRVERQIQDVVRRNLGVVVAVTDGIGYGSGVIVSEDGLVLTASHVLETGGRRLEVIFPDGRKVRAKALGKNLNVDAAMLKLLEPGPWPHAELGHISDVRRGDWCICMGHSGGYELGRNPPVRAGRVLDFEPDQLVTDCALIGGDSGGPLFDLHGRLIGIHSSIGSSVAENRHVSVAAFRRHWDAILAGQKWGHLPDLGDRRVERPAMGIRVDRATDRARIATVHPGGPADKGGLRTGDIVIQFDGAEVEDSVRLIDLIKQHHAGDRVLVVVLRKEKRLELTVELEKQE